MHVTSIDGYGLEPGVVTEWAMQPIEGSLTESLVPPSYNQHFHLETARTHGVGRSVWMAAAFDLPGQLNRPALEIALRLFISRHDTLHTGFEIDEFSTVRLDLNADTAIIITSDPLTTVTTDELRRHLKQRFTLVCDPLTFPAYTFATVERDEHYTVLSAFDHTLVDGYSLVIALGELRQIYEGLNALPRLDDAQAVAELMDKLGNPGSFVRYCELEADGLVPVDNDPRIREWERFYEICGGTSPSFPLDLGVVAGQPAPQGADVRVLLDAERTADFDAICLAAGGSVFTGILTAMGLTTQASTGKSALPLQFPLHIRKDPRWADAIGWLTTSAPITVQVTPDADFGASLAHTHASFRVALTLEGLTMAQVRDALGGKIRRTRTDVFMVSYIDYRKLPGTDDHELLNAHHISNVTVADDAQFWISRTNRGLSLRSRFPDTGVANVTMVKFLTELGRILQDICERGVTPIGSLTEQLRDSVVEAGTPQI
ncbi:condensation domain-containing protein [Rhodococcus sp. ARC_M6]|uniref:condensation domain-containing protein n=1 Tax=Rhodococcus sp. ARC_M6 TaxID=2928852 RepID=UPI001FB46072|nr:condensation domain-containing protein [Rhodococcus sp. ARC_M6]MCJ0903608.1 condensation domain-containing protein [Rhodococcus sp. ARC_M6]